MCVFSVSVVIDNDPTDKRKTTGGYCQLHCYPMLKICNSPINDYFVLRLLEYDVWHMVFAYSL